MRIRLILAPSEELVDEDDKTGLTEEGYEELMDLLVGWEVVEGPVKDE